MSKGVIQAVVMHQPYILKLTTKDNKNFYPPFHQTLMCTLQSVHCCVL